ncbi:MAG TPA: M20 family metallo-hydrolase [Bacteroidia bacterium]|jgi:acetylornithine deacetylase|nr:M20 family metallo-hydrolase [Bacteroidia bacterium]
MVHEEVIELLKQLISIPSHSKEEKGTADAIQAFMEKKGVTVKRHLNNVWATNKYFDASKPTILLNSHHDTVKPNKSYTKDPHSPIVEDGKLYGLGSNDAGASLVSLLATILHFYDKQNLRYNLVFAATSEEEISGANGIAAVLPMLGKIDFALVGEPTQMQLAIAEKGVIVLDCIAHGKPGHAAREEGINAIYKAIPDINWFKDYSFPKVSELLGPVKMSVTIIKAGSQHNVVPDICEFTVDVRVNECYTNEEVLEIIKKHVSCDVKARSLRLKSSFIPENHPIVVAGKSLGLKTYGSPTISDRALMPFPSLKIGPGDSARSHIADEFIYLQEIKDGIDIYIKMLDKLLTA